MTPPTHFFHATIHRGVDGKSYFLTPHCTLCMRVAGNSIVFPGDINFSAAYICGDCAEKHRPPPLAMAEEVKP